MSFPLILQNLLLTLSEGLLYCNSMILDSLIQTKRKYNKCSSYKVKPRNSFIFEEVCFEPRAYWKYFFYVFLPLGSSASFCNVCDMF